MSFYGLKQAPIVWISKQQEVLVSVMQDIWRKMDYFISFEAENNENMLSGCIGLSRRSEFFVEMTNSANYEDFCLSK